VEGYLIKAVFYQQYRRSNLNIYFSIVRE